MKNFTPFGRLLLLAVFLLSGFNLSAQSCGLTSTQIDDISIDVETVCQSGIIANNPFVVIDFGDGSGFIDGDVIVTLRLRNGFITTNDIFVNTNATTGVVSFELPGQYFTSPSNVLELREVTVVGSCTQNFVIDQILSDPFSLSTVGTTTARRANSFTNSPPCQDSNTGQIGALVSVQGGGTAPNRLAATLYPFTPNVNVFVLEPGAPGNPDPNEYLVYTTRNLPAGEYQLVIDDLSVGCSVVYTDVIGDPATQLGVALSQSPVICFGDSNGSITVSDINGGSPAVGNIFVEVTAPNGTSIPTRALPIVNGEYAPLTIPGLEAGAYSVKLISSLTSCEATGTVTVGTPEDITINRISAAPICASQQSGSYSVDVTGVTGIDDNTSLFTPDSLFYSFIDTSATSGCWGPYASYPLAAAISASGSYNLIGFAPDLNCINLFADTTVSIGLEIFQNRTETCSDTFFFDLFIQGIPDTADAVLSTTADGVSFNSSTNDTLVVCSGEEVTLSVANFIAADAYELERITAAQNGVTATGDLAAPTTYTAPQTGIFDNTNAGARFVSYRIRSTETATTSCASAWDTVTVRINPTATLEDFALDMTTDTICNGFDYTSPVINFVGNNANMRYTFEWVLENGLTATGDLSGRDSLEGTSVVLENFINTATTSLDAQLTVTPVFPYGRRNADGMFVRDTCEGTPQVFTVTVEPVSTITVVGNDSTAVAGNGPNIPVVTICSGATIDFTTTIPAANSRVFVRREQSVANNTIFNAADSSALVAVTRNFLPTAGLSEALINLGSGPDTVVYAFNGYTYGPDGTEAGGDDCFGGTFRLAVQVLPALGNDDVVEIDAISNTNNTTNASGGTICSGDAFSVELSTSLASGRYLIARTTTGTDLANSPVMDTVYVNDDPTSGTFDYTDNPANATNNPVTRTYTIFAYTFGADGVDDGGAPGSDDCVSAVSETVSVTVEPVPVLVFNLNGTAVTGDTTLTICSGEDFLVDFFRIAQTANIGADWVELTVGGDASFLNLSSQDDGVYPAGTFRLGKNGVTNTDLVDNSFQRATLTFRPYFETGVDNTRLSLTDECAGDEITITVTINPDVPEILDQRDTLCSGEALADAPILGGTSTSTALQTITTSSQNFATTNEFIVPAGAFAISNIAFEVEGANGGDRPGRNGGLGYAITGELNPGIPGVNPDVLPGDTIRVVKGAAGINGDGGDASSLIVYAGSARNSVAAGDIVFAFVAAGGGGAGLNTNGQDASTEVYDLSASTNDGNGSTSFGEAEPGTGFANGAKGGAAGTNGAGGGGGGYAGGDAGNTLGAIGGNAGTSLAASSSTTAAAPAGVNLAGKMSTDPDAGDVSITYTLIFNDVTYTVTDIDVNGLTPAAGNVTVGTTGPDSLLYGDAFTNSSNTIDSVVYEITPSTAADCGSPQSFRYVLTIEPTPTGFFSDTNSVVTLNGDGVYETTICSGDSLDVLLSTLSVTSAGGNGAVYFFPTDTVMDAGLQVIGSNPNRASNPGPYSGSGANATANGQPYGGNNGNRPFPIKFFEDAIVNLTGADATITYTVTPYVFRPGQDDCLGTPVQLKVTVQPGFDPANITTPAATDVCSGESLADADFTIADSVYAATNSPAADMLWLLDYSVTLSGGTAAQFDTLVGPAAFDQTTDSLLISAAELEGYTFENLTGNFADIEFNVRLVSATGCASQVVTLDFVSRAAPVIAAPADGIFRDTICSEAFTLDTVKAAANSAFEASFANNTTNDIVFDYTLSLENGLEIIDGLPLASYPVADTITNDVIADTKLRNRTAAPLTATWTVTATATTYGCESETITFAVVVQPEPAVGLRLVSLAQDSTYSLEQDRLFQTVNRAFTVCAGQPISASFVDVPASTMGAPLMTTITVTDKNGITDFSLNAMDTAAFTLPLADAADTLSFLVDELVNMTDEPDTFTVSYFTFFQGLGCGATGVVEFDVVVTPTREAQVTIRDAGDINVNITTDTLCSGDAFTLFNRDLSNTPGAAIDSFRIQVLSTGLDTVGITTLVGDTLVEAQGNAPFYTTFTNQTFVNPTAGIKQVRYVVTPITDGCMGISDTATIHYRPEINLATDDLSTAFCIPSAGNAAIIYDINIVDLFLTPGTAQSDITFTYAGGDATFFYLREQNGNNRTLITNPATDNFTVNYSGSGGGIQLEAVPQTTPNANGSIDIRVDYDSDQGCTITDTITLTVLTEVIASGTADDNIAAVCEGNTPVDLNSYLNGASMGGVWTRTDGTMDNGTNGELNMVSGSFRPVNLGGGGDLVEFSFTYTVGSTGNGCPVEKDTIVLPVRRQVSAGTYAGTPINACQSAPNVNLFTDANGLVGAQTGGTFVQISAGASIPVDGTTGEFNQSAAPVGTYVYRYEINGQNGCAGDDESVVVNVVARENCMPTVPCDVVALTPGYNIISFDVIPNDNSIRSVFADEIASENLLRVIGLRPDVAGGIPQTFSFIGFDIGSGDNYGGNITDGIQPGYGYIVQVTNPTTIEVCGTEVPDNFTVPLQAGTNYVGYVPDAPVGVDTYFNQLTTARDLNFVLGINDNSQGIRRVYGIFPNPNQGLGPLRTLENGKGYLINVDTDYPQANWKAVGVRPTTVFDQFYGAVENGQDYAGEEIRFTNANGDVFGFGTINDKGYYVNVSIFGDMAETDELDGFLSGEEVFVTFRGEQYATGVTFDGGWELDRLDLSLNEALTPTQEVTYSTVSIDAYPNPTDGEMNVDVRLKEITTELKVEVYGALGQLVSTRVIKDAPAGLNQVSLDMSTLASGIYQLRVSADGLPVGYRQVIRK